ncbi:hypothetical protein GCM10010203_18400 [Actinomadura yumaensis]
MGIKPTMATRAVVRTARRRLDAPSIAASRGARPAVSRSRMAWHLYCWGDQVEVLAPEALKARIHDHRQTFEAMP